ncbi:WDGH domain-containing protein [Streptomyces aurantiogriseus]|uniref:WDGH domain-containing protein n=1 Tax=Streptomyces aurantiogriseus TaxID=66870 RepID=A0A918L083_9ACTN|nr:hypothetical protein [Streptomyces aurantiogriseus]GGR61510.1 hypothetical protein GCM10010251_92960 [Streptomyces aurantiogriseus]
MDGVYRERAHLVAHLAAAYPSAIGYHDPDEPDWAVVIIELPTGQASWHVSPDDMDLFAHVQRSETNTWDGHSTEEKYARIDAHTRALAQKES